MIRCIKTTEELAEFCQRAITFPYVTVDTEFLRERTYYPKLCLVQLALPGPDESDAVLVDPLAEGMDLAPLYALMADERILKVFHAARQDIEIFHSLARVIPTPLFDTQVAAMVCGFGEQTSYETLAKALARAEIDKSSRFTDWSRRPLSDAQLVYALADVTHLRTVYEALVKQLEKSGRTAWVAEEHAALMDPALYVTEPVEAWKKVRTRSSQPRFLGIVRELARFREEYAIARDLARGRVFKDDALLEIASAKPQTMEDLQRCRLLLRDGRKPEVAEAILAAVKRGLAVPVADLPEPLDALAGTKASPALGELLRVLLKAKSEKAKVAPRLIAASAELDLLAQGERELPVLKGWRFELFGEDALRLCDGKVAITWKGKHVKVIEIE